ncbi:iron chelate uptake ABC transporter family permease subunit [Yimella sp. cx-51]|nr:iron chelate uptake ABC transporter family permease subunit [Yimella sp. cx-51]MBC9955563.1 iron chelate uptake ABC transporter family permease subunit [Yimella sp. cx-51]QTH39688.1 iron chelate uptake ABC transporter family permease subunit [Yimella sp. cx-51]
MAAPTTKAPAKPQPRLAPGVRLALLAVACVVVSIAYLTTGVEGDWAFALERRSTTLATMVIVGVAIAVSTVAFHAITANQILTPSIMGFDALYLLIQTLAIFVLGITGTVSLNALGRFGFEVVVMVGLSLLLFRWLLGGASRSLHLLVLVGIVIGGVFRSTSSFLQRLMDPTQFIVLQDRFFADFNSAPTQLIGIGAALVAIFTGLLWRSRHHLDVLSLGRDSAIGLGIDHRRAVLTTMVLITVLVAVSTALVGPTSFFGLLVAHLAYQTLGTSRHSFTIPAAAMAAVLCLVGGQLLFERLLGFEGSLSMVVEFIGGIVFIVLLIRRSRRT